jgi:3-dehydroquinate dehydratase-2
MRSFQLARAATTRHRIAVIEGPNQTNLGRRSKRVYGEIGSLAELQEFCTGIGDELGIEIIPFASNFEGSILEFIHESAETIDAYVVNPAGLTVGGIATKHTLFESGKPFVEVHFANVSAVPSHPRGVPIGPWKSTFSEHATGVMMGLREYSYVGAILGLTLSLDDETFLGDGAGSAIV